MSGKSLLKSLAPDVGRQNEAPREKWLEAALRRVAPGSRILDAGAGTQRYKKFCSHLNYVSQDIAQYDGVGDDVGLQTGSFDFGKLDIVSDIGSIPEPDASFDAIMCIEVFEHLPDPQPALREFGRLLKPGGTLIITSPFCSLTHFAPYHYATGFSRYWYEWHLPLHGFEAIEVTPNGNFFEFLGQELYRLPSVADRYAGRRPGLWGLFSIFLVQRMLRRLSSSDNGSKELLYFGNHVSARRSST
jgi:SAM-dependent methyltransferase